MENNIEFSVNSSSITPLIGFNETQLVFQRHCAYDKESGGLISESVDEQVKIMQSFIHELKKMSINDLKNTYFLFTASNTISGNQFKRCVLTTSIAMDMVKQFFSENHIPTSHIMNLNECSNYQGNVHESRQLVEPKMFTDSSGYLEYLKEKHGGMNASFWIDFEEDLSKEKREQLHSEGPDQIVERAIQYVEVLKHYSRVFHSRFPNSRLFIWCGTHYDLISPFVKQCVLGVNKSSAVFVDYCGGLSLLIDEVGFVTTHLNGVRYPLCFPENQQLHRHF